jgi:hypothetical protein
MAVPTLVDAAAGAGAKTADPRPVSLVARPPSLVARPPASSSYHATEPPLLEARRAARGSRVSASVVLAVVLGLVGLAVGGIALWLVLPHHKNTPPSPFVLPSSTRSPPPQPGDPSTAASVIPLTPDPKAAAAPAEPLPSLVPSPQPPRGRGRP